MLDIAENLRCGGIEKPNHSRERAIAWYVGISSAIGKPCRRNRRRAVSLLRLFVALDFPAEVRKALARAGRDCSPVLPGVRWTRPETLHLTLKFLGDTAAERVPEVAGALRAALASRPAGRVTLAGLGVFPNVRRPSVVWTGIAAGTDWVAGLAAAVDGALVPLGFPPETRPFQPHVTLGRVRPATRWPGEAVKRLFAESAARGFGEVAADTVALYASTLARDGAIHELLARLPLRRD
jgi:2'-5' RNA ligase